MILGPGLLCMSGAGLVLQCLPGPLSLPGLWADGTGTGWVRAGMDRDSGQAHGGSVFTGVREGICRCACPSQEAFTWALGVTG